MKYLPLIFELARERPTTVKAYKTKIFLVNRDSGSRLKSKVISRIEMTLKKL